MTLPPDTFFWMSPGIVSRACRFAWNVNPVDLVVATFCVNKAIQAVSFFGWWWFVVMVQVGCGGGGGAREEESSLLPQSAADSSLSSIPVLFSEPLTPFQLVIGAQLIVIGQILNVSTYRAIGRDGVYYGGEHCKAGSPDII